MIITIVVFILILGFLVLVHELGHYLVARWSGITVEEFGIGFPPKLYSKKVGKTLYSINAIPLGGFVKIKGDDEPVSTSKEDESHEVSDTDSFSAQPIWQRVSVICAGVVMNILSGWLLLVILFMAGAPINSSDVSNKKYLHDEHILIEEVIVDSPAHNAGLKPGDRVVSLNNQDILLIDQFQDIVSNNTTNEIILDYLRSDQIYSTTLIPKILQDTEQDHAIIGVGLGEVGIARYSPHLAVVAGTQATIGYINRIAVAFATIIKNIFTGNGVGASLGGPVAIAVATNDMLDLGLAHVIIFTAVLSFNLAIINILPFPALDGGRLVFLVAEKLRGKPSRKEIEAWFHKIGFVLLMLLAVVITYRDIVRFGGRIWKAVLG
jgi:regulator of sigma E protease